MTLQAFANYHGALLSPVQTFPLTTSTGSITVDAAGESAAIIGYVNLSTGPGTSKTISAAGSGKIHFLTGTTTFSTASTTLRVGINDVGATGVEDGTHDVFKDLVAGTDTITGSTVNVCTMGSGTKTIAHGDLIAIVCEMTARAGADSVVFTRSSTNGLLMPHATADSGSGPAKGLFGAPYFAIEFDDGTFGWLENHVASMITSSSSFNSGSTPDEHALVFQVPFKTSAVGLYAVLEGVASTDDFELILYSDPLGTPVAEVTLSQDMDLADNTGSQIYSRPFTSAYTLEANTNYAVALRPTTANSLAYWLAFFGSGGANIRKATALGTNWSLYTRTNQSGAFASQDTTRLPLFGVWLGQLSDDVGSGGTTIAGTTMLRGLVG